MASQGKAHRTDRRDGIETVLTVVSATESYAHGRGAVQGFSGRILRKLPFLAHTHLTADTVRFEEFVHALRTTCELERADRACLS